MSDDDHWVDSLSDDELRIIADRSRKYFGVENKSPVDVVLCLQRGSVLTRFGQKRLIYKILPDASMGGDDARTETVGESVVISVRQTVHNKAVWGEGRARMTLAHELAHAILHPETTNARRSGAIGRAKDGNIPFHRSAEHQAKVFAINFLVDRNHAARLIGAEEISTQFSISLEASKILYREFEAIKDKKLSYDLVQRLADDFKREILGPKKEEPSYIAELCPTCGQQKLAPIGVKYHCYSCGSTSDVFQDGDRIN